MSLFVIPEAHHAEFTVSVAGHQTRLRSCDDAVCVLFCENGLTWTRSLPICEAMGSRRCDAVAGPVRLDGRSMQL